MVCASGSQGGLLARLSPGNLLERQILGPAPVLLNQKPWGWGPAIRVLTGPTVDSKACSVW